MGRSGLGAINRAPTSKEVGHPRLSDLFREEQEEDADDDAGEAHLDEGAFPAVGFGAPAGNSWAEEKADAGADADDADDRAGGPGVMGGGQRVGGGVEEGAEEAGDDAEEEEDFILPGDAHHGDGGCVADEA